MATLTGNTVQSTYKSLIKINDNSELNATTPENLTDGLGNIMPLQVSQNQIKFTGILDADSATSILGFDAPKNIIIDGVGTWTADQVEDTVTFAGGNNVTIGLAGDTITWNVATSSVEEVTINNNTNNYVLTATGNPNEINGEASLRFDGSELEIGAAGNFNLILGKGAAPSTNPYISTTLPEIDIKKGINVTGNIDATGTVSANYGDFTLNVDANSFIAVSSVSAGGLITGSAVFAATSLGISDVYTFPITDGTSGQVIKTNGAGVLYWANDSSGGTGDTGSLLVTASSDFSILTFEKGDASTFEVDVTPREVIESVINKETVLLPKGTPVYVSGSTGNASHVYLADAGNANKIPASYVLKQDLASNAEGFGLALGFINGVDTSGFNASDTIYLAVGGGYTNVAPTGSAFIQRLGNVINVDATNGSGVFTGAGAVRGLPNIQSGYTWVGDADGVPQPVATSSFGGGVTINNNTDGYLLTATGATDTIDGEPKLRWNTSTQTLTLESGNSINGLTFDGGVFGAANPKISTTGFTGINVDTNLILENQTKIAFDTDAANTFIAADLTTPENLTINADGYVDVYIADGFRVWENNATPAPIFRVDKSGDFPRVAIGANVTSTNSELYVNGKVQANEYFFDFAAGPALAYQGETIALGSTATTAGLLYAWNGTAWILADADVENTARALLGIAIANTSGKGMLVNGWYKTGTTYSNGQLYMSATAGGFTTTPPSTTGQVIRVVGHGINDTTIRFNPSNEYYTVE